MKHFDYNNAYLNMKHNDDSSESQPQNPNVAKPVRQSTVRETVEPVKTEALSLEKQAVEKAQAERAEVQNSVNDVLYQDSRPKKSVIRVSKPVEQAPEPEEEVLSDENDSYNEEEVQPEVVSATNTNTIESGADSRYADSVVEDFKNTLTDETDDAVLVRPGDALPMQNESKPSSRRDVESVVEQQPVSRPVYEPERQPAGPGPKYMSGDISSATIVDKNEINVGQPKIYTDLSNRIQAMFPAASGAADAINAYLYIKLGYPSDVAISKQLKDVINSYVGDGTDDYYIESDMNEILDKITTLQSNDKSVMHKLELLEVLTAYLLCEYNGYVVKKAGPVGPSELSLCNSHVQELMTNLESIGASELANFKMRKVSKTSSSGRRMK